MSLSGVYGTIFYMREIRGSRYASAIPSAWFFNMLESYEESRERARRRDAAFKSWLAYHRRIHRNDHLGGVEKCGD